MAKNYTNESYAINKYSEGIVYRGADGDYEITLEGFLKENPNMTEEDFAEYEKAFGASFRQKYGAKLQKLAAFLEQDETGVRIKAEHTYVQDGVVAELLADL